MPQAIPTEPSDLAKNHLKYRRDIDGLRAIAILSVVGFHAFGVRGGFVGVDIFFVISGFLISTILLTNLENSNFSFADFYVRRVKRIFPALILMLSTIFIMGWFILLPSEYKQLGKHVAGASVFISNFLLWNEAGYFDNEAITKPLLHLWSLGVEEQFYIIWPLLLWITWKKQFKLIYTIAIIALISFLLNIKIIHTDSVAAFYSPQTRFWELLCGSFIAWLTLASQKKTFSNINLNRNIINNVLSLFGILLIIFCLFALSKDNYFIGPFAVLPTLGALFIILAGTEAWINRVILSHRTLVWFGLISFPLYLWHWPLLVFSKLSISGGTLSPRVAKILAVAISILLAWLTYKLIENPIRFGKNSKTKAIILIILITMIGCVGYITYFNNGLNFRVPEILQYGSQSKYSPRYRIDSCFQGNDRYHFGACTMAKDDTKKTILLWGDSHAAHFYAGYKERFGKNFNIVLISETGCRPILKDNSSDEKCNEVNNYILGLVKKEMPEKIVLSAAWGHHDDWRDVANTIDQLKKLGVKNIDLIGPAPDWIDTLPRQLFIYSRLDKQHQIPTRMSFGLVHDFLKLDPSMKELATRKKINYISLAKILCNDKGCMTRVGDNFNNLITLDYGHFTEFGSIYIVSKFPNTVKPSNSL
jgi:peptidoglycan/LPS O-acetylase OafA/YrhL